jgi:uncharacterized DUF497 family protein
LGDADFSFDPAKNAWLKKERGVSFEQIISLITEGRLIGVLDHPNKARYPGQVLLEVDVDGYVCIVPAVWEGSSIFLKTIYPSRKATRRLRTGAGPDEE